MPYDAEQQALQQFEQIMSTVFTCRSVVRYNVVLSEEQKRDLLIDIDTALDVLRASIMPKIVTADRAPNSRSMPAAQIAQTLFSREEASDQEQSPQQALISLYRMYHVFLDTNQATNINSFVTRFNEVMSTLNAIQQGVEKNYGAYNAYPRHMALDDQLQQVRVFIADLYYIFMEFLRVLSDTLQQFDVQLDTEKLSSLDEEQEYKRLSQLNLEKRGILSLFGAYKAHQHLNEKRGHMLARVTDATAFLEFMKENMDNGRSTRKDIIIQLASMKRLLNDLSVALTAYEKATSNLLSINK